MAHKFKILIADDDQAIRTSLKFLLDRAGYETVTGSGPEEIMSAVRKSGLDLIVLDMNYSYDNTGREGIELIRKIRIFCPDCPVILITAWGSVELAVRGIKAGAYDFITKPWNNRVLLDTIEAALKLKAGAEPDEELTRQELDAAYDFSNIIGKDRQIVKLLSRIARIADTNAPVLITGESGTGKELVAEAIHRNSPRKNKAFVKVNLGGMSASLFESEMFGHKKGAFTDAYSDRKGRFEAADGGSIFLDEIGELDLQSQVKLLRVLQEQSFERLGDNTTINVDVRIICATNRNLADMVSDRLFREDLLYRINLIHLLIPPLRDRRSDITELAGFFLRSAGEKYGTGIRTVSEDGIKWLKNNEWPGNVRELRNTIERAALIFNSQVLGMEELSEAVLSGGKEPKNIRPGKASSLNLEQKEKETIMKALADYGDNMSMVAKVLGISRATLYRKLKKYNLKDES